MKAIPAPDGYRNWLDYAVETMDTRRVHLERCWEGLDHQRAEMHEAACEELRVLRERVTKTSVEAVLHQSSLSADEIEEILAEL